MKKTISILLMVTLIVQFNLVSYAEVVVKNEILLNNTVVTVDGKNTGVIQEVKITMDDGYTISWVFADKTSSLISIEGNLYPMLEGLYEGDLLLGEFECNSTDIPYSVEYVRVEKENNDKVTIIDEKSDDDIILSISITNTLDGKNYLLQSKLAVADYNYIWKDAMSLYELNIANKLTREEYLDKLVCLDVGQVRAESDTSGYEETITSVGNNPSIVLAPSNSRALKTSLDDFTYTELNDFINAVKNGGSSGVNISSYNISENFFTNTGWDGYSVAGWCPYSSKKYTHNNGNGVYYTRLSMLDVIQGNDYNSGDSNFNAYLELEVKHGVMIEYVEGTNTARLYLDDYGVKIYNINMALGKLSGDYDNIFTGRTLSGNIQQSTYNITGLIGLIDELSFFVTLWSGYSNSETGQFNSGTRYFDSTVSAQLNRWNKVIREIKLESGTAYIMSEGTRINLSGDISCGSSWSYDWGYTYSSKTY